MKLIPCLLPAFAVVFGLSHVEAATALTDLASDRAALIVSIHDVPSVIHEWTQSPWAKTWNDEQVKRFFAPLREQMKTDEWDTKVKEKTGYTLPELLDFATGDAIMVLPDIDFARATPAKTPPVLMGVDVGANGKKVEALLIKTAKDENATDETTDFSGVVVHTMHPDPKAEHPTETPTVWAIVDGKWLFSPSKDAVIAAIDALHNGGASDAWSHSERYARLQQRAPDAQIVVSVNVDTIYPTLKEIVAEKAKAAPQNGFDPEAFLTALGFDKWHEIYGAVRLRDDGTEGHFGLLFSDATGLLKVLAYHDGPPPTPPIVSPNWVSVSTAKFSLKEAFSALEEILENFNPAISGMVEGQLRAMNKKLGIDLKRDLLGSLGDSVVVANVLPADSGPNAAPAIARFDQFFAVSLENAETFNKAVAALRQSLGPDSDRFFLTRDYLGEKIVTFQPPENPNAPQQKGLSYAIVKGYVLISVGSAGPIETALQSLTGKQPTLWDKPELKEILAQVPPNASGFQYQNVQKMVSSIFQSLSAAANMFGAGVAPKPVPAPDADASAEAPQPVAPANHAVVDPSAMPDAATISKYWDHSWGYGLRDSSGLHFTSHVVYPKP